tara:strand:+ start:124 stop:1944 length:1821 start_codon:yes stop_codon:yes gene_type:complete
MFTLETIQIPIISPIVSLIMFAGLYYLGQIIISFFKIGKIFSSVSSLEFQYALIGIIIVTFLIYPFIKLNFFNYYFIYFFSFILIILGICFIIFNFNKLKLIKIKLSKKLFLYLIISCYLLISLGLITDADSLDYHLGVPLYILNNESYPKIKFWMHLTKSGSGEIFYTIGLINNALQLPGLTQFAGIISIFGLFQKKIKFKNNQDDFYITLIALSCPVLIFFISSAKVQLVYVAASTLIFTLIFFSDYKLLNNLKLIILINIIFVTAISAKFSFALSSFILWFALLVISYKYKFHLKYIFVSIIIFSYILLPRSYYRFDLYDFKLIESLFKPLPLHLYGYGQLYESLTSCGYNGCFPYWLIFPKNLGTFTETLGIGSIAILLIKFKKTNVFYFAMAVLIIQIFFSAIFGPNNARWYIEPFMWGLITIKIFGFRNLILKKIFFNIGMFQSLVILIVLFYGVYSLTPGSFSENQSNRILSKNADGYKLFKWANKNLSSEDIIISTHRSFALGGKKFIPGDIMLYIDVNNEESIIYFEELKKFKPNLILFYGSKKNYQKLSGCLGELLFYKKNISTKGSRNPFNRMYEKFDGYIYKFNYKDLPNCSIN